MKFRLWCITTGTLWALAAVAAAAPQQTVPPVAQHVDTSTALDAMQRLRDADSALTLTADGALLYKQQPVKLDGDKDGSQAMALAEKGEFRRSVRVASQALYVALQGGNEDLLAKAYRDLAYAYAYAGNLEQAGQFARQALAHKANDPSQVTGPAYKVIATMQARRGDYASAFASYRKALDGSSDRDRPLVRLSMVNALIDAGKVGQAREQLGKVDSRNNDVPATQIDRTNARLLLAEKKPAEARKLYQKTVNGSQGGDVAYRRLWAEVGMGRSELAMGDRQRGLQTLSKALGHLAEVRARFRSGEFKMGLFSYVQGIFSQVIDLYSQMGEAAQAFDYSERSRARALLDAVRGRGKLSTGATRTIGATELRELLRPDERVVEFHSLSDRLLVWVVSPDGIRESSYPIPADQLNDLVKAFRNAMINGRHSVVDAAGQLGTLLIEPLGLAPGLRLIVVPNGSLHYLPFQALRVDGHYLVEQHPISVAPSISIAAQLVQRRHKITPDLIAFGNPKVAPKYALPGSEAEVKAITALFPDSQLYLRGKATKARFEKTADEAHLLHVAAHAQVDTIDPLYSRILLANEGGEMDFLEAHEVLGLNLRDVALVTLSACESGLGRIADGDEVLGFPRSFLSAGASSMIVSLWPVSDDATRLLMSTLYGELAKGVDLQTAMQHAQVKVMHTPGMQHPYFWAPFNVVGDWRLTVAEPKPKPRRRHYGYY